MESIKIEGPEDFAIIQVKSLEFSSQGIYYSIATWQ